MGLDRKKHIINMFNKGYFTTKDAEFYYEQGYAIICHNGKVIDIVSDNFE